MSDAHFSHKVGDTIRKKGAEGIIKELAHDGSVAKVEIDVLGRRVILSLAEWESQGGQSKLDILLERVRPWRERHRRDAWKPIVENGDGGVATSKFCGTPWLHEGASWPACRWCQRPLELFLQLNLSDLPEELGDRFGAGVLQVFYCRHTRGGTCAYDGGAQAFSAVCSYARVIWGASDSTPHAEASGPDGFPAKMIMGWERFDDYPKPSEHERLGIKYVSDFDQNTLRVECPELDVVVDELPIRGRVAEQISISDGGDKLAGWPCWIQDVEYPFCPRCGQTMQFVFQLTTNGNVPFMFGDQGIAYLFQCSDHLDVVAFEWQCH